MVVLRHLVLAPLLFSAQQHSHLRASVRQLAQPRKKGVDSYQTIKVTCKKCSEVLFLYKKKNGLKSNLVKCYVERIVGDPHSLLEVEREGTEMQCPSCSSKFARDALIHGRPALKMVGGKVRMKK